jgi:4-hydroxy-tetrahydrodipicolinate synthase
MLHTKNYEKGEKSMLKEQIHIAVPTAFYNDESLNVQGTIDHIKSLKKRGVHSVLVSGTTGEQHSLSLQEKLKILRALDREEELINGLEVIFGIASVRQREAEELAEAVRNSAVSGVMLGYPPYVRPNQEEAITYSESIIHLSEKPVILYNNPERTGFDLSVESIIKLSKTPSVIGIKDPGNQEKMKRLKQGIDRDDFYYYAGGEIELEEKVAIGYNRLSSIVGNVAPKDISRWFHHLLEKEDLQEEENVKIRQLMRNVYGHGNPLLNVKEILNKNGIPIGICRSPIGNT